MPKLSVLMSVYNGSLFLKEAIDSVLDQTFTNFEFIIYDDCSTDSSLSIIESYNDSRIKLIKNSQNVGLTVNLYNGMNLATGDYLARMDADDICMPDRFQKQLDFLEINPDISILGTAVIFFDETGKEILGTQPLTHEEIKVELLLGFTMLHPSVMMRLADMHRFDLNYNPHFRYSQDFDLWVRASRVLKLANLKEPLLKMREHRSKISRALKPAQKLFSDEIRKFQIDELSIKYSFNELDAFNLTFGNINEICITDIKKSELLIHKAIKGNDIKKKYNSTILKKSSTSYLISTCREALIAGNKAGFYFWKSKLFISSILNFRLMLSMIYKTAHLIFKNDFPIKKTN